MSQFKFLIIEDDLFYQTHIEELLSGLDVDIVTASDGKEGFALSVSEKPDLIIADIEIPGIQGLVLLRMLRERPETSDIPVILMSGKVKRDLLERHSKMQERADGYLLKPFSGQDLLNLVERVLGIDIATSMTGEIREEGKSDDSNRIKGMAVEREGGAQSKPEESGETLRALVVDDSRYICDIAGDFLQEIGFTVRSAPDGEKGFKEALDFVPDLVLLDVQMPKLNGFVVCEMLRKEETTKNAVIVLMSAVVDEESFEKHSRLKYHADAYLRKPFMKSELQDLVSSLIPRTGPSRIGLDGKTGFMVPSEDEVAGEAGLSPVQGSDAPVSVEQFNKTRLTLESLKNQYEGLAEELKTVRVQRDHLEDEVYSLRSEKDDREKILQNKLTVLTQRFEETKSLVEKLEEQNQKYKLQMLEKEKGAVNKATHDGLEGASTGIESLRRENETLRVQREREVSDLSAHLEESRNENDSLIEERDALKRELDERRKKEAAETECVEDAAVLQKKVEELEGLCLELRRDLSAAVSAKNEIEDQVKYILENRGVEDPDGSYEKRLAQASEQNRELIRRAEEAETKLMSLVEVESQLIQARQELKALEIKFEEENAKSALEQGEKSRRIAELESELDTLRERAAGIETEREAVENGLERDLKVERNLRVQAEAEVGVLKRRVEELSGMEAQLAGLDRRHTEMTKALERSEKLRGELEARLGELNVGARGHDGDGGEKLGERLDKMEAVLSRTVLEAQTVIDQQNAREHQLEENMRSLMNSLQEDREAFREEKEQWKKKEEELRTAFEDALEENRRIMGEETARLYPMLIPKRPRTLEVVDGTRKYGLMAAMVLLVIAVLALGYTVLTKVAQDRQNGDVRGRIDSSSVSVGINTPVMPSSRVSSTLNESTYKDIWERQTVQSVSDDIMIQATLHTPEELETAIIQAAEKEGWTGQRRENVLSDILKTYQFDRYYYVTVFSKNLRESYPGYIEELHKHIALRDDTGRETKAQVPEELEKSRFITSRISVAGKEMNPEYMYEVGRTISFVRGDLVENPGELQLVIYDVGAVPMRVLTWGRTATGS